MDVNVVVPPTRSAEAVHGIELVLPLYVKAAQPAAPICPSLPSSRSVTPGPPFAPQQHAKPLVAMAHTCRVPVLTTENETPATTVSTLARARELTVSLTSR